MDHERLELSQPLAGTVNVYRVGDTLVDTGHVAEQCRDRIRDELDGGALDGVERVVLTHPHIDHVGGSQTLPELAELPHVVYEGAPEVFRDFVPYLEQVHEEMGEFMAGHIPEDDDGQGGGHDRYFPLDLDYAEEDIEVARVVGDGDTVRVGPQECEVVHTPGHSNQHMALFDRDSGEMFTGDVVSVNGHFTYGPVYWDVGDYEQSLRRIRDLDPDRLLPGHGDPMDDPAARCTDGLEKADRAKRAILAAVEERGPLPAHELARAALGAEGPAQVFLTMVASAYALHLAEEGQVAVERRPDVVARPV